MHQWESEIAGLLTELSSAQQELLECLIEKRRLLLAADSAAMEAMQAREHNLLARLQACHDRRADLLARAADQHFPSDSIRSLANVLPSGREARVRQVEEAAHRSRLLRHHSLTNWVLIQRSLVHLSQLLEIIATQGRGQPTYGREEPAASSGSLIDQAA